MGRIVFFTGVRYVRDEPDEAESEYNPDPSSARVAAGHHQGPSERLQA